MKSFIRCILAVWFVGTPIVALESVEYSNVALLVWGVPIGLFLFALFFYEVGYRLSAFVSRCWYGVSEWVKSKLPRRDIGKRAKSPSETALDALLSHDKRDLLHWLTAGPSQERFFILRDIGDEHLALCLDKLGDRAPEVAVKEYDRRMSGKRQTFERSEVGQAV